MSDRNERATDEAPAMSFADMARSVKTLSRASQAVAAQGSPPGSRSVPPPPPPRNSGVNTTQRREGSGLIDLPSFGGENASSMRTAATPAAFFPASVGETSGFKIPGSAADSEIGSLRPSTASVLPTPAAAALAIAPPSIPTERARKGAGRGILAGAMIAVVGVAAAGTIVWRAKAGPATSTSAPTAAVGVVTSPAAPALVAPAPPPANPLADLHTGSPGSAPALLTSNRVLPSGAAPNVPIATAATLAAGTRETAAVSMANGTRDVAGKGKNEAPASSPHRTQVDTPKPVTPSAVVQPAAPAASPGTGATASSSGLTSAMQKAIGAAPEPAAAPVAQTGSSGNIPDSPSQGAIQSALSSRISAAKQCVKGMPAPSRADVLFGSSGKVESVTVTGAAAGTPNEACVKKAFMSSSVGPFRRATFSVGVPVRP